MSGNLIRALRALASGAIAVVLAIGLAMGSAAPASACSSRAALTAAEQRAITAYVEAGGRYLGICQGAYLAGHDPGMGLLGGADTAASAISAWMRANRSSARGPLAARLMASVRSLTMMRPSPRRSKPLLGG